MVQLRVDSRLRENDERSCGNDVRYAWERRVLSLRAPHVIPAEAGIQRVGVVHHGNHFHIMAIMVQLRVDSRLRENDEAR